MDDKNKTIAIGKDKDPYEVPLNLIELATFLEYFSSNGNRDLKYIFSLLGLDLPSRREFGNTVPFEADVKESRALRSINKGLTMEIFTSGMFGYIDHPAEVHANCTVSHYYPKDAVGNKHVIAVPHNFAQRNMPDAQIDYEDFMVILEVSAKHQPSLEFYKKQLNGALKHARSTREKGYDKPIYCLLINECDPADAVNKEAMQKVLKDINSSEQIYITAISVVTFARLGQVMAENYEEEITKIRSDDLHNVLKAIVEKGVSGKFHEIYLDALDAVDSPYGGCGF